MHKHLIQLTQTLKIRHCVSLIQLWLSFQFVSDYSGQHNFMSRAGPDGLHIPEKEATVSNILQIIRYTSSMFSKSL